MTVALLVLVVVMTASIEPSFGTAENVANITRNFAPFGIMALGMTVVIITGGIDLSVGSIMGLVAIVAGLFLTWEYPWYVAFAMGMLAGLACGAVNGFFVAYVGMPSFVVTLGMLSIARSLAVVFSGNQMLYQFGPDAPIVKAIGQAKWPRHEPDRLGRRTGSRNSPRISGPWWSLALIVGYRLQLHGLGPASLRHRRQRAGGAADRRATSTGSSSRPMSSRPSRASVASLLLLGYNGSAINAHGPGLRAARHRRDRHRRRQPDGRRRHRLSARSSARRFLEVIRNALLMAGIDSNWQGAFVGAFIILAVLLGMQTRGSRCSPTCWQHLFPGKDR